MVIAVVGALSLPAVAADKGKEKPPELSEDVRAKLKPAQDACGKEDWDGCIARANEALAVAKKPYDKEMSLRFIMQAEVKKQDFLGYAGTAELMNDVESVPADEKLKNAKNMASIYYQNKAYDKAEKWAKVWAEGSNSPEAYHMLMAIYYSQQDCANTIIAQEKENELQKAAGQETSEQSLKILNGCYYKTDAKAKREAVMEELVRRFPKPDYYTDLMQIYLENKLDKRAILNLYRFGFEKGWISRESFFVDYVSEALDAGAPAEAAKVIEAAAAKGSFPTIAPTDRNSRLKARAAQQSAEDKKQIAGLDREARAKQNGEADVTVGLAYLSLGENDKAVEALERGLSADRVGKVKRVDDAEMLLGIAYKRVGKTEEAKKAFGAAQKDERMVKAATLWLQSL
ncbi:MAG: hypothetical protein JSR73_09865 [Proteobacteria bacterium]|nr:hypothetical protein [Pseudomonadota bacterium]